MPLPPSPWEGSRAGSPGPAGAIHYRESGTLKYTSSTGAADVCRNRQRSCRPTKNRVGKKMALCKETPKPDNGFYPSFQTPMQYNKEEVLKIVGFRSKIS